MCICEGRGAVRNESNTLLLLLLLLLSLVPLVLVLSLRLLPHKLRHSPVHLTRRHVEKLELNYEFAYGDLMYTNRNAILYPGLFFISGTCCRTCCRTCDHGDDSGRSASGGKRGEEGRGVSGKCEGQGMLGRLGARNCWASWW